MEWKEFFNPRKNKMSVILLILLTTIVSISIMSNLQYKKCTRTCEINMLDLYEEEFSEEDKELCKEICAAGNDYGKDCGEIEYYWHRDYCYREKVWDGAWYTNNPILCENAAEFEYIRDGCYYDLAIENSNISLCEKIINSRTKKLCKEELTCSRLITKTITVNGTLTAYCGCNVGRYTREFYGLKYEDCTIYTPKYIKKGTDRNISKGDRVGISGTVEEYHCDGCVRSVTSKIHILENITTFYVFK